MNNDENSRKKTRTALPTKKRTNLGFVLIGDFRVKHIVIISIENMYVNREISLRSTENLFEFRWP